MKRVWKILIGVAVVLVVLVVAAVLSIDAIAKVGIEKGASVALGVKATVKSVSISFLGGSAEVKGLTVGNLPGHGEGNLLEVGRAYVKLKPMSVFTKVIDVDEVTVDKALLNIRQEGLKTNLSAFIDSLNSPSGTAASPSGTAGGAPAKGKGYKVAVINLTGARANYAIGSAPAVPIILPDISLKDIGSEAGTGATIGSIIKQVIEEMAKSVAKNGADIIKNVGAGVGTGLKKAGTGVEGAVKGIGGGIGGLFKHSDSTK